MPRKPVDLTGRYYGRLLVLNRLFERKDYLSRKWVCLCDPEQGGCGKIVHIDMSALASGEVRSCGCWRKEKATKHGLKDTPEYDTWINIKSRCYNEKNSQYKDYGGRGIAMSDEWKESFEAFYRDMGPRPSKEHSIDREKNDQGYNKDNCRWATRVEQQNNTSRNVFYEYNRVSRTLPAWCRELGLNYSLVYQRIHRGGWTFKEIIDDHYQHRQAPESKGDVG